MKLNRSAWHYKLIGLILNTTRNKRWDEPWETYSLCGYFWLVVLSIFMVVMMVLGAVFVGSIAITPLFYIYAMWFGSGVVHDSIVAGTFVTSVFLIIALVAMIVRSINNWYKKVEATSTNIAVEYILAKKRKVCPIIEFED